MKKFVEIVGRGEKLSRDLTRQEAAEAMRALLAREGTAAQVGGFLIAKRIKGESAEECVGFTLGARDTFEPPALAPEGSVDFGPPHDGRERTAPLTWLSAVICAAGGVGAVTSGTPSLAPKHGVGVPEVLETLGVDPLTAGSLGASTLETLGLAYQPVEQWLPAWESYRPVREELGLRTIFNTVEKLLNPCRCDHAVVGVFHKPYLERLGEAMRHLGLKRAAVVQGTEGGVVPSVRRKTRLVWVEPEGLTEDVIDPKALGLEHSEEPSMPKDASAIARGYHLVMDCDAEADPAWRDAACLASGLAFALTQGSSITEGARRARQLLDKGEVARLWKRWTALVAEGLTVSS